MTVMVVMVLTVNNSLIAMTMVTMTVTAAVAPIIAQATMKLRTTVMTTVHTHMKKKMTTDDDLKKMKAISFSCNILAKSHNPTPNIRKNHHSSITQAMTDEEQIKECQMLLMPPRLHRVVGDALQATTLCTNASSRAP